MTLNIAAMKADREAGTPGPWEWLPYWEGVFHKLCHRTDKIHSSGDPVNIEVISDGSACGEYSPDIDVNGPDARRIARVPDMEETILAQVAEIERLKHQIHEASDPDFLFGAMDNVNDLDVSLTDLANAASRAIRAALGDCHE